MARRSRGLAVVALTIAACWAAAAAPAARAQPAEPEYVLIDGIAPFFDPEKPPLTSWGMPFGHMDLPRPPWVDEAHLERALERFERYCAEVAALGFNGVIVGNLIHMVTFDRAPEGPVYAEGSPRRARHLRYRRYFRKVAEAAHRHGLRLVVETDFPVETPELRSWLAKGAGDPRSPPLEDPRLWAAWRAAVAELFDEVQADALSVRIGEGGGAYDDPGMGYRSRVGARTIEDARRTVRELLEAVEAHNAKSGRRRRLLFRTWTIGIGRIGTLHTNPNVYEHVFSPFYGREALVTVVKHVAMDFFHHAPRNPTIGTGRLRQIVEFQARREYEGFGLFPNFRAASAAEDLRAFRGRATFAGISVWPTMGGFLMPAPIYWGAGGPVEWIDANVYAYARLARDPELGAETLAREWAAARAGLGPADAERVAAILLRSAEVVNEGLYVSAYARRAPALFGLDVFPPMLWLWWTRPAAAWSPQALIARAALADPGAAIREGERAVAALDAMLRSARDIEDRAFRERLLEALRYERGLLVVLAAWRRAFLSHFAWALTGKDDRWEAWRAALPELEAAIAAHRREFAGSRFLPAFDCRELDAALSDDRWIPWLRPLAALLLLLDALVAALLVTRLLDVSGDPSLTAPPVGRLARALAPYGDALDALAAAASLGLSAALLVCFRRGALVALAAAALAFAAWGVFKVAARVAGVRGSTAAVLLAPLAVAAVALAAFAARGPALIHYTLVSALFDRWAQAALAGTGALAAIAIVAPALRDRRRAAALVLGAIALAGLAWAGAVAAGPRALLALNDVARIAPSVLGEAGTGVEDLIPTGGY